MTETTMPSGWGFDPMNPGQGPAFNLEPGVASDEELWYRSQLGMNAFDMPQWQPDIDQAYEFAAPMTGKALCQSSLSPIQTNFLSRSDNPLPLPRFHSPQADNQPYSLEDLLRTASQLATERALYMNIPPISAGTNTSMSAIPHSPAELGISSPGASPSHHSSASEDEHDMPFEVPQVYQLPDANTNAYQVARDHAPTVTAPAPGPSNASTKEDLTPLEMPDGTTRFTANWLPVDPQGGFSIRPPSHQPLDIDPALTDYQGHFHPDGQNSYNYRHAFISLENMGNEAGV